MPDDPSDPPPPSPWRALVGLVVIVMMIGAVWFIAMRLRDMGRIQDCVASGRTNCAPISGGS